MHYIYNLKIRTKILLYYYKIIEIIFLIEKVYLQTIFAYFF